jgi:hypothetical protein
MRIKLALWTVLLMMSFGVGLTATCFAQSSLAIAPEGSRVEAMRAPLGEVLVATILPKSPDQADVQTDDAATYKAETAASEPALPAPSKPGSGTSSKVGIGVKISSLGAGIEVATPLAGKLNVRGGFNMFRYDRPITNSGIHYDGQLRFQSAEAHLDWFPFWGFHISPGLLFYNGNQVSANAAVPGGQTFSLGGTTYESDPTTPVSGTGKLDFVKVSPSIMLGVGNLIPRSGRHYSFLFEVGGAYQGSARVALNLTGNVCDPGSPSSCRAISSDPTVQANIQAQQVKIQNDVNPYRFFPVISLGVGFNF